MDIKFNEKVTHSIVQSGLLPENPLNSYHVRLCKHFMANISKKETAKGILSQIFDQMKQVTNDDDLEKSYEIAHKLYFEVIVPTSGL